MAVHDSQEDITALLKERADIVQIIGECVDLKKSGARFLGCCPFHSEKTPSFSVHPGQQFYYCFGCGESGDVFSFMMKYHNLDFPSVLKELARRYQVVLPEKQMSPADEKKRRKHDSMFRLNGKAVEIYQRYLHESPGAMAAREYLERRGVSAAIQKKFGIGYAPHINSSGWDFLARSLAPEELVLAEECGLVVKKDGGGFYDRFRDRVLFPIADLKGRVCGFGGRILGDGQPKYMNSPESPIFNKSRLLLGLYQQQEAIRRSRKAILVEGNFDLISLVSHGCENVAAPLGTALTREQLQLLKRQASDIILLFDGDAAGVKAAVRAVPLFLAEQIAGKVALLPAGHDPDTFVREQGASAVFNLIEKARPLPEFVLDHLIQEHGLTLDGKNAIIAELQNLIKAAANPLQRTVMIAHFGEKLGVSPKALEHHIPANHTQAPPQETLKPVSRVKDESTILTDPQKKLLTFMILFPQYFHTLADQGSRTCLKGSIGEILFLQMQSLFEKQQKFETEDLLTLLPEGAERNFVVELFSGNGKLDKLLLCGDPEGDLKDLLAWMRKTLLVESSKQLFHELQRAQESGDLHQAVQLYAEKQRIDQELDNL